MRLRARKPRQNALAKSQGVFCFSTLTTETLPALSSPPRSLRDQSLQQNRPPPDRFAPRAVVIHCAGVEDLVVLPEFVNDPFWPAVLEPHRCRIAGWFSTGLFEVVFLTLAEIVINPCKVCRRSGVQTTEQSPVVFVDCRSNRRVEPRVRVPALCRAFRADERLDGLPCSG
jgi:hypothetical protein